MVYASRNSEVTSSVIDYYKSKINRMSVQDLLQYQLTSTPIYDCKSATAVDLKYFDVETSVHALLDLIYFQNDNNIELAKEFFMTISDLLDGKIQNSKINTVVIVGPPNSGKNFFVDAIQMFCLNTGKLENPSRNCNFPWMHGFNRRFLKWNEARLDPYYHEQVLDLLQGLSFSIKIKFKPDAMLTKTPLIVMSNYDVFPNEPRFNIRYYRYLWKECPLLLKYTGKSVHPVAIGLLLRWINNDVNFTYDYVKGWFEINNLEF